MPRKCQICSHAKRKQIDKQIVNNFVYVRIASDFSVPVKSIENHAKNHVKVLIKKANEKAEKEVIDKILEYRREVNFSALDKVKFIQDKLLNELEAAVTSPDKLGVIREFRGWLIEEAKLSGSYQKDKENNETLEITARNILRAAGADSTEQEIQELIDVATIETRINRQMIQSKVREFQEQNISDSVN